MILMFTVDCLPVQPLKPTQAGSHLEIARIVVMKIRHLLIFAALIPKDYFAETIDAMTVLRVPSLWPTYIMNFGFIRRISISCYQYMSELHIR